LKKNKNISIEDGIEQLKDLTLNENNKKKLNKNEFNQINNNKNKSTIKKFIKNFPTKRNYLTSINKCNNISNNNNINNNSNIIISNSNQQSEKEKENESLNAINELNEREKERKKMELKTVDEVANELLQSKDENDLREYLFDQLQLLQKKKIIEYKLDQMKNTINQLNRDKIDLRRCNNAVSRALNKKIVEDFNKNRELEKLNIDIDKVIKSINYHEYMGDLYKEELKKLKMNI
jgi:hypothetical protein